LDISFYLQENKRILSQVTKKYLKNGVQLKKCDDSARMALFFANNDGVKISVE